MLDRTLAQCLLGYCAVLLLKEKQEAGLPSKTLISIIDDDEAVREAIAGLIEVAGVHGRGLPIRAYPDFSDTSCLIADVHMPRMTGIELHRRLAESGDAIPTILITAYPDDSVRTRALADGVICYLTKPVMRMLCLDASGQLWSGPGRPGTIHDRHSACRPRRM